MQHQKITRSLRSWSVLTELFSWGNLFVVCGSARKPFLIKRQQLITQWRRVRCLHASAVSTCSEGTPLAKKGALPARYVVFCFQYENFYFYFYFGRFFLFAHSSSLSHPNKWLTRSVMWGYLSSTSHHNRSRATRGQQQENYSLRYWHGTCPVLLFSFFFPLFYRKPHTSPHLSPSIFFNFLFWPDKVHLLWILSGGMPRWCYRGGTQLRICDRDARGALVRQGQTFTKWWQVGSWSGSESRERTFVPLKSQKNMFISHKSQKNLWQKYTNHNSEKKNSLGWVSCYQIGSK